MLFFSSADNLQNHFFGIILSGIPSECQTVWIKIRPDIMSGLIEVQTVCKGYQQTALVGKELLPLKIFPSLPPEKKIKNRWVHLAPSCPVPFEPAHKISTYMYQTVEL